MPYFSGEKMTGGYGGPDIINSCSINVNKGEIVTILGPNGAGKSTAMKALLGMLNLRQGKITFNDADISNLSPQDRVKKGISFVPQTRNVFTGMSVEENLEMGAYIRDENFQDTLNEIYKLFPVLKEKRKQFAGQLSGGQRQQVEVFDNCKANGFQEPQCAKWLDEMQLHECRENKDAESDECKKYRTWVMADQELEEILKNAQNEE